MCAEAFLFCHSHKQEDTKSKMMIWQCILSTCAYYSTMVVGYSLIHSAETMPLWITYVWLSSEQHLNSMIPSQPILFPSLERFKAKGLDYCMHALFLFRKLWVNVLYKLVFDLVANCVTAGLCVHGFRNQWDLPIALKQGELFPLWHITVLNCINERWIQKTNE